MKGPKPAWIVAVVFLAVNGLASRAAWAQTQPSTRPGVAAPATFPATSALAPRNVDELRSLEAAVGEILPKVMSASVTVFSDAGQGSGVVVSKDGYVLTAGHAMGRPDSDAWVVFPDGRRARAKALGQDRTADAGMLKLVEAGPWPFVEMGHSAPLKLGQFVVALGQPSDGYRLTRAPVVRLGRILRISDLSLETDCTLDHGDSGGPLYDLQGKLVGINGAIGSSAEINAHVPIDIFSQDWNRLSKGEVWGVHALGGNMLGVSVDPAAEGCRITGVADNSPADKAGIKAGDLLQKFAGADVRNADALAEQMSQAGIGQEVVLTILRDGQILKKSLRLLAPSTRPMRKATPDQSRQGDPLKSAFRPVVATAARSVVRVRCAGKEACLGTLVSADGFVLTQASVLHEPITCVLAGTTCQARIVSRRGEYDLAMLKLDFQGVRLDPAGVVAIAFDGSVKLEAGRWVAAPGALAGAMTIGVISLPRLGLPPSDPAAGRAYFQDDSHFPAVFQHDAILRAADCGGPVVDLDGRAIGLNISRPSRAATYAIPADVIVGLLDEMKAEKSPATQHK